MSNILNKRQIEDLKASGKILAAVFEEVGKSVKPGMATIELDELAESALRSRGAEPAFKWYRVPGAGAYPAAICASINDEVVHGLPRREAVLRQGDIVSIDIGARYRGMCTDAARTYAVGKISEEAQRLITITKRCLDLAISVTCSGANIGAIGKAVQALAESNGFGVVRDLVGHGIGPEVHLSPQIPNFGNGSLLPVIAPGMALAIEPMLTAGDYRIKTLPDKWTIVTADGSLAAHFEDTVVIENNKATIVTR